MISRATLRKASFVLAVIVLGGLLISVSRDDFAVSGVSGVMAIFRVHVYAQVLALILVVLVASGWIAFDHAPRWFTSLLILAVACYVMSLHSLAYQWTTHELVDRYWPFYSRRLSIVPSDASLPGVTCSRDDFVARFVNEKKDGMMNVFLGVYPWRIDRDRFDEYFRCEERN
jgi:hypothetical protein